MRKSMNISVKFRFFFRSLLKYILVILLPLCILSVYSLSRFREDVANTMEAKSHSLMYHIGTEADSMFLTVDTIAHYLNSSNFVADMAKDVFIGNILSPEITQEAASLGEYLRSICISNEHIYRAYLHYDNSDNRTIIANNSAFYTSTDPSILSHPFIHLDEDLVIVSRNVSKYSLSPDEEVISVRLNLYSERTIDLPHGILLIDYSAGTFREYISKLELYPGQIILFMQENNVPLFQTQDGDYSALWGHLEPSIQSGNTQNTFSVSFQGSTYIASYISAALDGLYYVSLIPTESLNQQSKELENIFLAIALCSCVISIFLAFLSTQHDFDQLSYIADIFNGVNRDWTEYTSTLKKPATLYQVIARNIIDLFLNQQFLKLQIENKQYQLQLLELQSLQHQINPHFLFNTLNLIYWESVHLTNQPNKCSSMVSSLSQIMSYAMTVEPSKIPLHDEIAYLQHYAKIQEVRYDQKIKIVMDADENALPAYILKMVLQPLLENSISHGLKEKPEGGIIKIRVRREDSRLYISVLDNGMGMSLEKIESLNEHLQTDSVPSSHIGLQNVNRRLRLAYGDASQLQLRSKQNLYTNVSFSIPIELLDET